MRGSSRQERKVVTAVFCDLVGFTSQAEQMDPEDVAAVLNPYHARLKEELERYGGTVEKFIGDAVMALFGAPVSHEDDPERAVRAALAIRGFASDEGLELRIGIATGEALVTLDADSGAGETMATGDVVNTAARLQSAAPVNGILVAERTFLGAKDAIDFREREPVALKGKASPVPIWEALAVIREPQESRSHATQLVGRARELDLLSGVLERARVEMQPQLVTLVGVPGMGKSRLVYELEKRTEGEPVRWLEGRCLPYGDGVTLRALAEVVRAELGVDESDPPEVVGARLSAVAGDDWVKGHLRSLLGLEVDDGAVGRQREEAYAAWRSFLEAAAADTPLVVVFDDLHWADDVLLDFVDHLVDWASGVCLAVVCAARPELLERRPAWGGGKTNGTTISLSPLSDEDTSRLVASVLGSPVIEADVQSALLSRAAGNPLYAEQFARLVDDEGEVADVPESVHGLIAARLDLLAPEQKALLQDGSVIGRAFWLEALAASSGADPRRAEVELHALERKGFIRRERSSAIADTTQYAFQHVLVADVAYGQIPRAARSEKHRVAAEWITTAGRPEEAAELCAHHYAEALALGRAARLDVSGLEEPARLAFRRAADRAFDQSAYGPAERLYGQALELWPEAEPGRAELLMGRARAINFGVDGSRFDLFDEARVALLAVGELEEAALAQSLGAVALRNAGRGVDAMEHARAAVTLLERHPQSKAKTYVLANCARLLAVMEFEFDEAVELAAVGLADARELDLPDLEAHVLNTIGTARVLNGDAGGVTELEESLRVGLEHCSPFEVDRIYNNVDAGYYHAGLLAESDAVARAALELRRRIGLPTTSNELSVAVADFDRGHWSDAWEGVERLRAECQDQAGFHLFVARLSFARDDLPGAAAACERALELLEEEQWNADKVWMLCVLRSLQASIALTRGEPEAGTAYVEELLAIDLDPWRVYPFTLVEIALTLSEAGRNDAAAALRVDRTLPWDDVLEAVVAGRLVDAADQLGRMGSPTFEADVRWVAAQRLVAEGRRVEADEQLRKLLVFYRSVDASRYVRKAEALLSEVA